MAGVQVLVMANELKGLKSNGIFKIYLDWYYT